MKFDTRSVLAVTVIALSQGMQWLFPASESDRLIAFHLALSALFFGILWVSRRSRLLFRAALLGLTLDLLPHLLISWAAQHVQAGITAVALCSVPFLLLLNTTSGNARNISIAGIAGMMIASASALALHRSEWPYLAALLAAAASIACSLAYAKKLLAEATPAAVLLVEQAAAAVLFFSLSGIGLHGGHPESLMADPAASAGSLALSAVSAWLTYWVLARREPPTVAAIVWLQMAVSIGAVAVFLRERPSIPMLAGAAMLLASFVALWREHPGQKEPVMIRVTPAS